MNEFLKICIKLYIFRYSKNTKKFLETNLIYFIYSENKLNILTNLTFSQLLFSTVYFLLPAVFILRTLRKMQEKQIHFLRKLKHFEYFKSYFYFL